MVTNAIIAIVILFAALNYFFGYLYYRYGAAPRSQEKQSRGKPALKTTETAKLPLSARWEQVRQSFAKEQEKRTSAREALISKLKAKKKPKRGSKLIDVSEPIQSILEKEKPLVFEEELIARKKEATFLEERLEEAPALLPDKGLSLWKKSIEKQKLQEDAAEPLPEEKKETLGEERTLAASPAAVLIEKEPEKAEQKEVEPENIQKEMFLMEELEELEEQLPKDDFFVPLAKETATKPAEPEKTPYMVKTERVQLSLTYIFKSNKEIEKNGLMLQKIYTNILQDNKTPVMIRIVQQIRTVNQQVLDVSQAVKRSNIVLLNEMMNQLKDQQEVGLELLSFYATEADKAVQAIGQIDEQFKDILDMLQKNEHYHTDYAYRKFYELTKYTAEELQEDLGIVKTGMVQVRKLLREK